MSTDQTDLFVCEEFLPTNLNTSEKETTIACELNDTGTNQKLPTEKSDCFSCNECEQTFRHESTLQHHHRAKHTDQLFLCDQCDFKSIWPGALPHHVRSKHLGVKYYCDQCDYKASQKQCLKKHMQFKHAGGGYSCTECKYKSVQRANLKRHIQAKHGKSKEYPKQL